jgi:hypothetical protein
MACSLVWMLAEAGRVDQDLLAGAFAQRCEPNRGYGVGAFTVLRQVRQGLPWREAGRLAGTRPKPGPFLDAVLASTPDGRVRRGIARARKMLHLSVEEVAYELGSGHQVTAQDTVPFTLWVAARCLNDYRQAICDCVRAGGDVDTTSAIAGGIAAAYAGMEGIPEQWRDAREPLPGWLRM